MSSIPIIQKRGLNAFFFFFDLDEISKLAWQLEEVTENMPNKDEIKELIIRTAEGT